MKNNAIIAIIVSLVAFSCKEQKSQDITMTTDTISADSMATENKITVDSVRIHDSLVVSKTLSLEFNRKFLTFTGLEKPVLDSLYVRELPEKNIFPSEYSKETVSAMLKQDMQKFFSEMKIETEEYMPSFKQVWDQVSEMKVYSEQNGFLTVQYVGYGFMGGAHGYAFENYKTVDVTNQKIIKLEDIVDVTKVNWNEILRKNNPVEDSGIFEPEKLSYNQNFYFDNQKITFVYGQYEIAPYASGIISVEIPFSEISSAIKPDFKDRMKINIK